MSCIGDTMSVDHGRTSPPEFGVGDANANCPLQIFVNKKERSMAFKIRQNPLSAGALGELMTLHQAHWLERGHPFP